MQNLADGDVQMEKIEEIRLSKNCDWQFHTVDADGRMFGYNYPPSGMGESIHASEPCAVVPNGESLDNGQITRAVADMVTEHCGGAYTPLWQGRGWTVDIRSGYPLWQTNG